MKDNAVEQLMGRRRTEFADVNAVARMEASRHDVSKRFVMAVFAGSLGGLVFGFDLGALSAATPGLQQQFGVSPWRFGLTISASIWGTVFGSILAGRFADRLNRKTLIAACGFVYAAAALSLWLPVPSEWLLVLAMRFLNGMAIGGFTVGCPLYLSELAPVAVRGRVVSSFQVMVGLGVLLAFAAGALFATAPQSAAAWKTILSLGAVPALVLIAFAAWMPQPGQAEGPSDRKDYGHSQHKLFTRKNARVLLLATSIAVFNQLSGVNILLLYMLEILASAGVNLSLGHRYTVLISGLGLGLTLLGMKFVDRLGRKPLLYAGSVGMALCLLALGFEIPRHAVPVLYLSILTAYNAFFAFSQGTVVWVYLSELFPPGLRGAGQGFGSTVHWVSNAVLVSVFPRVQHASSAWIFYMFAGMMVLQILVIRMWYPETRGTALGWSAPQKGG